MSVAIVEVEERNRILAIAADAGIYATVTLDQWGDIFSIVEGWGDVRKLHGLAIANLEESVLEEIPQHEMHKEYPNLDWLLGDWGFSDEYSQCSHCQVALHTGGSGYPMWYFNDSIGEYTCAKCIKESFEEEYLEYAANSFFGDSRSREIVELDWVDDPTEYGWARCNEFIDANQMGDFDLPSGIEFASDADLDRLFKAARLVDPTLQMFVARGNSHFSTKYIFHARLDPNGDYAQLDGAYHILTYAVNLVSKKYTSLLQAGK